MQLKDFKIYTSFFHDGTLDKVIQLGKTIELWMESAELIPEWIESYSATVNENNRIKGILHLKNTKHLIINDAEVEKFTQSFNDAEILDLDIEENSVKLSITYYNQSTKVEEFQQIQIDAENIYWENIPDLIDGIVSGIET